MRTSEARRTGKNHLSGLAVLVLLCLLIFFAIRYWGSDNKDPQVTKKTDPVPVVAPTPRYVPLGVTGPTFEFGGKYRGVTIGVETTIEIEVIDFKIGVERGIVGSEVKLLRFRFKDFSLDFVPEDPKLFAKLGTNQKLTLSPKDGFGRELGVDGPIKGSLKLGANVEVRPSPFMKGQLEFDGANKTIVITPSGLTGPRPSAKELLDISKIGPFARPAEHVVQAGNTNFWYPAAGYKWLDTGTRELRESKFEVQWDPGQLSIFPAHVRAARDEGYWDPDPGYQWADGSRGPRKMGRLPKFVQWAAGQAWPGHPNVVTSDKEGRLVPAPGYTWTTQEPGNLNVRPLKSEVLEPE